MGVWFVFFIWIYGKSFLFCLGIGVVVLDVEVFYGDLLDFLGCVLCFFCDGFVEL